MDKPSWFGMLKDTSLLKLLEKISTLAPNDIIELNGYRMATTVSMLHYS